jgi:hypothetical protein
MKDKYVGLDVIAGNEMGSNSRRRRGKLSRKESSYRCRG